MLTGVAVRDRATARQAADMLLGRGVKQVFIPAGDAGDLLVTPSGEHWLPRFPVTAVDATGAGDALTAAFTVALIEGRSPADAGRFATAAAALATTKFGAQSGLPTRSEIEQLLSTGQ